MSTERPNFISYEEFKNIEAVLVRVKELSATKTQFAIMKEDEGYSLSYPDRDTVSSNDVAIEQPTVA